MDRDFLFAIAEDEEREGSIPKADILAGIRSDEPELAGAIYDIVTTDKLRSRIEPLLTDKYAQDCILDTWESEGGSSESFVRWKKWMEKLYRAGDEKIKRAIVEGILEHLFEKKGLRQSFADWKADSELKTAYDEAQLWADTQPKKAQPGSA